MSDIALIGECMLEISHLPTSRDCHSLPTVLSYGGDTLNTAVYAARMGVEADYVTVLGDDSMSQWMLDQWTSEHVGVGLVCREKVQVPGLYLIEVDEMGERSFLYWRDQAPARRLFDDTKRADKLFNQLMEYPYIYLSGITLAIYSKESRDRLLDFIASYRRKGGKLVFDGNYRPQLWESAEVARDYYRRIYAVTDVALSTLEDECMVFGECEASEAIERLNGWGVGEIVMKLGEQGCVVAESGKTTAVPSRKVQVVDTTSAGDSFNGGYMAARIRGESAVRSAEVGCLLASEVVQHRGALILPQDMPRVSLGLGAAI